MWNWEVCRPEVITERTHVMFREVMISIGTVKSLHAWKTDQTNDIIIWNRCWNNLSWLLLIVCWQLIDCNAIVSLCTFLFLHSCIHSFFTIFYLTSNIWNMSLLSCHPKWFARWQHTTSVQSPSIVLRRRTSGLQTCGSNHVTFDIFQVSYN